MQKKTDQDLQENNLSPEEENRSLKNQLEAQNHYISLKDDRYFRMMLLSSLEQLNQTLFTQLEQTNKNLSSLKELLENSLNQSEDEEPQLLED